MEELYVILERCCPNIDFRQETHLIDDGILESLDIVMLVGELSDAYDVEITVDDLVPENFNSAEAIFVLLTRLLEEA